MSTAAFTFLRDLGAGVGRVLQERTLKAGESLTKVEVKSRAGGRTAADREYLDGLDGQAVPPTYQKRLLSLQVRDANGKLEHLTRAASARPGDPALAAVPADAWAAAQVGVRYLAGGPFTAAQRDTGGAIVSRRFLAETCKRADPGPAGPFPARLDLYLRPERDGDRPRWEEPAFDGIIPVPVVGVFEYPPLVEEQDRYGLPQVYLPEGFLHRLATGWEVGYAFHYPAAGRAGPLVEPYRMVTELLLVTDGPPTRPGWAADPDLRAAVRGLFRVAPDIRPGPDGLLVRLSPKAEEGHRVRRHTFDEKFAAKLRRQVRTASGAAGAAVRYPAEASVAELFPATPPAGSEADVVHDRAYLRVARLEDVLRVARRVRAEQPGLDAAVADPAMIEQLLAARAVVGRGSVVLDAGFLYGLTFVLGLAAYTHVLGKTGDIGILRAFGQGPWKIAGLYQMELSLVALPPAVLGVALAWAAAGLADGWVARVVVPVPAAAPAANDPAPAEVPQGSWTRR